MNKATIRQKLDHLSIGRFRYRLRLTGILATTTLVLASCGEMASSDESGDWNQEDVDDGGDDESSSGDDDDDDDDGQDDEDNRDFFTVPQISGAYIYAANTETGKVAVVHATSLRIEVVSVGAHPTAVRALHSADPQSGAAAVLHADGALALLATPASGASGIESYAGVPGANAMGASASGRFVVVYHDIDEPMTLGPGSDQEIVVIDRQNQARYALSVGLHPYDVSFAVDESTLHVHTQDGISIVDLQTLSPNSASRLVPVMPGGVNPKRAEVLVVPSVNQALVRVAADAHLYVTDLGSAAQFTLDLGAAPNDLDLVGAGTSALLTVPGAVNSELLELTLPANAATPIVRSPLANLTVGSAVVASTGDVAILYATGDFDNESSEGEDPRRIVSIAARIGSTWQVKQSLFTEASIHFAGIAPDAASAILVHDYSAELNPSAPWPYTMLDLRGSTILRKVQSSLAQPSRVVYAPDGASAGLLLRDDAKSLRQIDIVNLRSLVVHNVTLGSPPQDLGFIPESRHYFSGQSHPAGRLSLIDEAGTQQTLTGFELGSK